MKKKYLLIIFLCSFFSSFSQVGIGTTNPDPSAILELNSTEAGLLISRMLEAEKNAIINPATGLLIYQTDNASGFYYYSGTAWLPFSGGDNDWTINGNDMYNANSGNVGIGTTNPSTKLHIESPAPLVPPYNDFEAGLAPLNTFGDAPWAVQTASANGGVQSAQSGVIGDNQKSVLRIPSLVVTEPGTTISFFVEVGSEPNFDELEFSVNNTLIQAWSGIVGWTQFSYTFNAAGTYLLKWKYEKDISTSSNGDFARVDDIVVTGGIANSALRIVDGNEGTGKVLTSDANGNASWSNTAIPTIATFQGMEIPICNFSPVGTTGNFSVDINGTNTTVSWEVLARVTTAGQVATNSTGDDVLLAPFSPERLQVRYDFSPPLPFTPRSVILSANNTSSFPDTFSLNYASKSASSLTMNITRTDTYGNISSPCWQGQFYFDVFMTN